MAIPCEQGLEALNCLRSTEPPLWLAPSTSLAETARAASQHLFSVLRPHAPKSSFDQLLINGFDAEQIWQQIDLQSQSLLSGLRRDIRKYEKNPEEILKLGKVVDGGDGMDVERFDEEEEEEEGEDGEGENEGGEETDSEEGESEGGGEENGEGGGAIEDEFLKIKELEEFMEEDEAREYGLETKKKKKSDYGSDDEQEEEEEEKKGEKQKKEDDAEKR